MDFLSQIGQTVQSGLEKAKGALTGTPAAAPPSVLDGYPSTAPPSAGKRRKSKKTKKGGRKSRRKTARRV